MPTTSARSGKFAHEADGRQPADRAVAQGYRYCLVAENLALNLDSRGFETRQLARDAVEGWKASPGHRANMLQPQVTEIGVAVVRAPDPDPKFISVQLFGRPEALRIAFKIENRVGTAVRYRLGDETITLPAAHDRHLYALQSRQAHLREGRRTGRRLTSRATAIGSWCARKRPGRPGRRREEVGAAPPQALGLCRGSPRPMQNATAGCHTKYRSRSSTILRSPR